LTIGSRGPWRRRGLGVWAAKAPRRRRSSSLSMPLGLYFGFLLIGGAFAWLLIHPLVSVPIACLAAALIAAKLFAKRSSNSAPPLTDNSSGVGSRAFGPRGFKREPIPAGLRWQVFQRDRFTCVYCGRRGTDAGVVLHIDHRVPVVRGGRNDMGNLVTACQDCNLGKSSRSL
jgi:hypothetical protein